MIRFRKIRQRLIPGTMVFGYVRALPGQPDPIPWARQQLKQWAAVHRLALGTVFVDASYLAPAERPGFHSLQNLVAALRPAGVVVPSSWHFSIHHDEVTAAVAALTRYGCAVLVVSRSTTAGIAS